jgi:hypothetical protein
VTVVINSRVLAGKNRCRWQFRVKNSENMVECVIIAMELRFFPSMIQRPRKILHVD